MTTTTQDHGAGLPVASVPGATDPPDPEHHEPPRHLDSSEEVPVLRGDDIEDAMPTEDGDGKPVGVAEGQDEDDDDPWMESFLVDADADRRRRQEEDYTTALAIVEGRYPNADPDDRVAWARAVASLPQSVGADGRRIFLSIAELDALEAKLGATNVRSASADPDEGFDADAMHALADELGGDPDVEDDESTTDPRRPEWDGPEQGTARVIPENEPSYKLDGVFAFKVAQALWMSGYASSPRDFDTAVACLRREYPEMNENCRRICAYALSGHTSYPVEGESARVAIDLTEIEAWVAEVLESRRHRAELGEAIQSAATRAVEDRLPHAVRGFTARLETPWYKSAAGAMAIAAVALVILFFSVLVLKEERALSRIEARRDAAAASIGTVYDKDGQLVDVHDFEELLTATGSSPDPAAREVRTIAQVASLDARVKVIEDNRTDLNKDRDDALATATLETDRRVRTEVAFDALEEVRRQEQADYDLRQRELESRLSRAERALGVAALDAEAARVFYKDHVRAGRCGNPLDEDYPQDAGGLRAHYQCDFGRVVCAGRLPSEANNCRRVER